MQTKIEPNAVRQSLNLNGVVLMLRRRQADWFEVKFQPNSRCRMHSKRRLLIKGYVAASKAFDQLADITEAIHSKTT